MRLSFAISAIALITRIRGAPSNAGRSGLLEDRAVYEFELDYDGLDAQEAFSWSEHTGELSTQITQTSFKVLETDPSVEAGEKRSVGWYDPRLRGGRMLDYATPRLGEPLNVIISAHSDPYVLTDSGLHMYAKSIDFSEECLGLHLGNLQQADLGDGNGKTDELFLARQYYFPVWGTCWESVAGGNHFRAWKQNGTLANSGAWFLAVSKEENSGKQHKIVEDGYNVGRDLLVDRASRVSHHNGMWWKAVVEWNEDDLLKPGAEGINHNIAQDGRVAILTVQRI
ncbi:hypothetical protein SCHPADRAFT_902930 [Schizopora paradoxa]|uniref:Secreted protein n=1 Tax=Schizopora paradoxa TaxID=27342 RepID=A0A0H2RSF6_9AGAM|nr:hypothetical protein SCHPADRAFT_902930 [Schizopora paradoxa]